MTNPPLYFRNRIDPILKSGDRYTLTAGLVVSDSANSGGYGSFASEETTIAVAAPPLILAPSDLLSVSPPPMSVGGNRRALPHVIMRPYTLPWAFSLPEAGENAPWLALLVFDDGQLFPGDPGNALGLRAGTAGQPPAEFSQAGWLAPQTADWDGAEPCRYIGCSVEVLRSVLPKPAELPLLVHARSADKDNGPWYATVLGNRLPTPGKAGLAHLVSVRGLFGGALDRCRFVCLLSLASWSFTIDSEPFDFKTIGNSLVTGSLAVGGDLGLRGTEPPGNRRDAGFAKLPWHTRYGEEAAAWYRGPLVPGGRRDPAPPFPSVWEAMRYDPADRSFDLSLAAAWQLGAMLAASDGGFARDILALRRHAFFHSHQGAVKAAFAGVAIDHPPATVAARSVSFEPRPKDYFAAHLATVLKASQTSGRTEGAADGLSWFGRLLPGGGGAAKAPPSAALRALSTSSQVPARRVVTRLAALLKLTGLGFSSLVPDGGNAERWLPAESLRAFRLDNAWLGALLDGALSVGGGPLDGALRDEAWKAFALDAGLAPGAPVTISGILLRSALVRHWPGLEVAAVGNTGKAGGPTALKCLRRDLMGEDILFFLFGGDWTRLEITEPVSTATYTVPTQTPKMRGAVFDIEAMANGRQAGALARDEVTAGTRLVLTRSL